ncbi:MAG: putative 45.4 kDa protein in thiaminase I 5'region (Protein nagD) [Parcubacteria group bacterium Athens1014_10]|nr:MAG: putative 45.4 kDa protein in thiaminase I 5'region (Protein nagD) [Parcubacteria group bacterium Athens1014_10]TSD05540.1 MAG: putative 45.4 kDa protein in thiaminase I 5'region (Protein nagD) [Parcubacteria group bacterium Athens0714_12]
MSELNEKIKLFAFDLDGILYIGDNAMPGAVELVNHLREKYQVVFFTNNSSKTSRQVHEKLNKLRIECALNEVYTSSSATADYLKESGIDDVYVVGSKGFREEIRGHGIRIVDDDSAKNLVVGLDFDFSYDKIAIALSILLKGGKFIVCNKDRSFHAGENKFLPGCGAIVGAISAAADKKPDFIVGKPNTYILSKISKDFNVEHDEIVVVGDSYESDIKMALNYKSKSILINNNDYIAHEDIIVFKDLKELLNYRRREK